MRESECPVLPADNPITGAEEDRLGRNGTANSFARQIREIDTSEGLTVGVFGPWGSGKTSFIRLVQADLQRAQIPVIEFNPWMLSGMEPLVTRLFADLSSALGQQDDQPLKKVGELVGQYGDVLVNAGHLVSLATSVPGVSQMLKSVLAFVRRRAGPVGLSQAREQLEDVLRERGTPIVVVLDDVDRLTLDEIRQLFKLVRLTACFPNLIYIVLCDRQRVEQALEDGVPERGRHYLEKIIQLQFDLPVAPRHLLQAQLQEAIERALPGRIPITEDVWEEIRRDVVMPLIGNLRDVRRYVVAVRGTVLALDGEIEISDILGLEAVRVFLPGVFEHLRDAVDAITFPTHSTVSERDAQRLRQSVLGPDPFLQERLRELVASGEGRRHVVDAMLKHLFPYGVQLLQADENYDWVVDRSAQGEPSDRRVADEPILRHYLERVATQDLLSLREAEHALSLMEDGDAFRDFMRGLPSRTQIIVIRDLCTLNASFEPKHVEPGVVVLLNLLPDMPRDTPPELSASRWVRSAVYFLLRVLDKDDVIENAATRVLPRVERLASKTMLATLIALPLREDEKLLSDEAARRFGRAFADEIREAFERDEIDEAGNYSRILSFPARAGIPIALPDTAQLAFRIAHSAKVLDPTDNRGIKILDWERLALLYGDRDAAEERVKMLCADFDEQAWLKDLEQWGVSKEDARETIRVARQSFESMATE